MSTLAIKLINYIAYSEWNDCRHNWEYIFKHYFQECQDCGVVRYKSWFR